MKDDLPPNLPGSSGDCQSDPPLSMLTEQLDCLLTAMRRTISDELDAARSELAEVVADVQRARSESVEVRAAADAEAKRIRTAAAELTAAEIAAASRARDTAEATRRDAEAAAANARADVRRERARLHGLLEGDLTSARAELERTMAGLRQAISVLGPAELEAMTDHGLVSSSRSQFPDGTASVRASDLASRVEVVRDPVSDAVRGAIGRALSPSMGGASAPR